MKEHQVTHVRHSKGNKTAPNLKTKTTIRRHKSKRTESVQEVQESINNMKEKFAQNFFDDVEVFILLISNVL